MDWTDLRKFTTQHKDGDNRPAAFVRNPKRGDLIVLGPTHETILQYLKDHLARDPDEEGWENAEFTTIAGIVEDHDGDEFDKNGGRLTMI